MTFVKGKPKTGGKVKGTPNKITQSHRQFFDQLLNDYRDQLINDLSQLEPKDRIAAFLKLAEYCTPKLSNTQMDMNVDLKEHFSKLFPFELKESRDAE